MRFGDPAPKRSTALVLIRDVDLRNAVIPVALGSDRYHTVYSIDLRIIPGGLTRIPNIGQMWWISYQHGRWVLTSEAISTAAQGRGPGDWLPPVDYEWQEPTLLNSWVVSEDAVRYRKTLGDIVVVRGRVQGGTAPSAVFQLPGGYLPSQRATFAAAASTGTGQIQVLSDGQVTVEANPGTWISLACTFYAG